MAVYARNRSARFGIAVSAACWLFAGGAMAGPMEDAAAATARGDHAAALALVRPLAENGDVVAQIRVALAFEKGQGAARDPLVAVRWFRRAADQGHPIAQDYLGYYYATGQGLPKDEREALAWYRKAALQGFANAQMNLGLAYARGGALERSLPLAHAWLSLAVANYTPQEAERRKEVEGRRDALTAQLGPADLAAAQKLAREWQRGRDLVLPAAVQGQAAAPPRPAPAGDSIEKARQAIAAGKPDEGIEIYERLVKQGNVDAMVALGRVYWYGRVVDKYWERACDLFEQAIGRANQGARIDLGRCFAAGKGRERDLAKAVEQYQTAAAKGQAVGHCAVGALYLSGNFLPKDTDKGIALCEEGARKGDREAEFFLAERYYFGTGLPRAPEKALHWFTKAAEHGDRRAMFLVGRMHMTGDGTARSDAAAEPWLVKARTAGDVRSYALLGDIYHARAMKAPPQVDRAAAQQAIEMYDRAMRSDPEAEMRTKADQRRKALVAADPELGKRAAAR